jgi:hypothetical protein
MLMLKSGIWRKLCKIKKMQFIKGNQYPVPDGHSTKASQGDDTQNATIQNKSTKVFIGVLKGVALKFHPGPQCPTLLRPAGGLPLKRHVAVFYPFGHPTSYAYAYTHSETAKQE